MPGLRHSHLLVLAVFAVAARAADNPPPPATAPSADPLAAARRDFDAVKGARAPAVPERLDLPSVTTPMPHLTSDEMSAFMEAQAAEKKREQEKAGKSKRSANWLVDAMEQRKQEAEGKTEHAAEADGSLTSSDSTLMADRLDTAPTTSKRRAGDEAKVPPAGDNPLTGYMAGWMTSKDFELLKVRPADGEFSSAPARTSDRAAEPAGLSGLLPGGVTGGGSDPRSAGRSVAGEPRSNPYLADLGDTSGLLAGGKDVLSLPAPSASTYAPPAATLAPKGEIAPIRTEVPIADPLKPSTDAKYFRQLKRF